MKTLRVVAVLACLALPSCYEFDFPLDPTPQVRVDARLVGTWRCLGVEANLEEAPMVIRIERRSDFLAHWNAKSQGPDEEPGEYDVHGSTVKGGDLLNLHEMKNGEAGKWTFVRYSLLLPDVLRLQLVKDEPFEKVKGNARELRSAVEKRRNEEGVLEDFCVCLRAKVEPSPSPSPTPIR